jgi:MFS family permease
MTAGAYRQIAQVTDFRRFWIGFTLSVTGDALSRVALTWLVYDLTGSAAALGWLLVCFTGPIIVGGLLAGWLLDRFDRRQVMLIDNLARGAAMALIPLLGALGVLALWHLYAVAAVYGLLMMISLAGGPSLVPRLVPPELLATANALEMLSFTLGGVLGPLAAGLLIPLVGAPNVLILDALSYAIFALLLARVGVAAGPRQALGGAPNAQLGHAVQLLVRQPVLLATTLMFLTFNIGGGLLAVALPLLVDQRLTGGPRLYGALLGVLAGGEVLGALVAGQLRLARPYGLSICVAQLLSGVALGLTLLPGAAWVVALGLALYGALSAPLTIWAQTLRMRVIPDQLRGRTFALLRTLMQSGSPLGGALGALLLPLAGVNAALAVAALLVGAPGLLGLQVTPLRTDRLEPPPDGAGASEPAAAGGEAG